MSISLPMDIETCPYINECRNNKTLRQCKIDYLFAAFDENFDESSIINWKNSYLCEEYIKRMPIEELEYYAPFLLAKLDGKILLLVKEILNERNKK